MSKAGVKGLTIFSLVKQEKLSNLFEIVAKALRKDPTFSTSEGVADGSQREDKWDYAAMTLPCIDFPFKKERSSGKKGVNPLFITVSGTLPLLLACLGYFGGSLFLICLLFVHR